MGRELTKNQSYSEETARKIDSEVDQLLRNAFKRAYDMIEQNKDKLDQLVELLLERETMDGRDVEDLIKLGHLRSPEEHKAEEAEKKRQAEQKAADKQPPVSEEAAAGTEPASVEDLPESVDAGAQTDADVDLAPEVEQDAPSDLSDDVS